MSELIGCNRVAKQINKQIKKEAQPHEEEQKQTNK